MTKGIYTRTEETRKNMSRGRKGMKFSQEHRKNLSLSHIGYKQSDDTKIKHSKTLKEQYINGIRKPSKYWLGKKRPEQSNRWIKNNPMKRPEQRERVRNMMIGNKNRYIDGRSENGYPLEFKRITKSKIIQNRDKWICQLCGDLLPIKSNIKGKKKASVHHIDYNKNNNSEYNLITLCNFCNTSVNTNRNEWTTFFQNKLNSHILK